ncbi:succinate dehydrogenase, hydrophobic membrane anchor protein [Rhodopila sp.]|uniref:succinate dehydrogenase, hydrophobic membrane anchor protein n=1 Tax=Rhodopila sp. TaxID=2480087 RepID=UPI003D132AEC
MSGGPRVGVARSAVGAAHGRGSTRAGSHHWWAQRLTALCLVPLSLWFIYSVIRLSGASHQAVINWMSSTASLTLMLVLIVTTFHHLQLGMQMVIEDYVRGDLARWGIVLAVRAASALLATACIVSVLKIGL